MSQIYYYNLVPLIILPVSAPSSYTYSSEKRLKKGQETEVKFRNKSIRAIVWEKVKEKPNFRILKIQKITSDLVILNKKQRKLAEWISKYYWSSLGTVLRMMTPSLTKRLLKHNSKLQQTGKKIKVNRPSLRLTPYQKKAVQKITAHLNSAQGFLLYGATGSGKTEVYLRVIEEIIQKDQIKSKQIIVLVPEISLTPQAIERYSARFPGLVSVLHSRQNKSERFKEWLKIKKGQSRIIIGPRSAIFAPIKNLGLIILDEEHDSSFKQADMAPRYDARKVAFKLAQLHQCPLILGSATPSVNFFYAARKTKAKKNKIELLKLPHRIHKAAKKNLKSLKKMPRVQIIDLRQEIKKNNFSVLSQALQEKIKYALLDKKQVLLFINRRGASSFVICRKCGWVAQCNHCSVPLVYHFPLYSQKIAERMICHHCGLIFPPPRECANCKSKYIKYLGTGTQKVEAEIANLFPQAKVARMDRDTTSRKNAHQKIYQNFKNHKIDILIGTQMITKGWDLPQVDLVGILAADSGLHLPDFRSAERIFQLLAQVAGRAGRGKRRGEVILQTYSPKHFVIQQASQHNYLAFYQEEIKNRKKLNYPPFSRLVKLVFQDSRGWYTEKEAKRVGQILKTFITKNNLKIEVLGPAPMFIARLYNKFRWQIILKILDQKLELSPLLSQIPPKWKIDLDAESLL